MNYQMLNRDTGLVVYQAEAPGWRQFKIAYTQWAQTTQQGILSPELREIRVVEPKPMEFDDNELRLLGRVLLQFKSHAGAQAIAQRIEAHLNGRSST